MARRHVVAAACAAVAVALAVWTAPAGAQFVSNYLGRTFTSNAPSGVNGFACRTNGCRVDLGAGASDYLYSNGTNIIAGGSIEATGGVFGPTSLSTSGSLRMLNPVVLPTCIAGYEGFLYRMASTGGTGTIARTRLCLCTSDGAASPAYAWQNLATGTVGTATTCNP